MSNCNKINNKTLRIDNEHPNFSSIDATTELITKLKISNQENYELKKKIIKAAVNDRNRIKLEFSEQLKKSHRE